MYIFMHALHSEELIKLVNRLGKDATLETFLLIPSMLLELNYQGTLRSMDLQHDKIYELECITGVRWDAAHQETRPGNLDLTALIRDVNSSTTHLAYQAWWCKNSRSMLDFLDDIARQYREQAALHGYSSQGAADIESRLLERHEYLRSWLTSMEWRIEYLNKRGQAQFQTVRKARPTL